MIRSARYSFFLLSLMVFLLPNTLLAAETMRKQSSFALVFHGATLPDSPSPAQNDKRAGKASKKPAGDTKPDVKNKPEVKEVPKSRRQLKPVAVKGQVKVKPMKPIKPIKIPRSKGLRL